MLFLNRHVLSLESACSSRKLVSSVYCMMHTCIICKNIIVTYIIIILLLFDKKLRSIDSLIRKGFCWPNEKMANMKIQFSRLETVLK